MAQRIHKKNLKAYNKARMKSHKGKNPDFSIHTVSYDYVKSSLINGQKLKVNIKEKRYNVYDLT